MLGEIVGAFRQSDDANEDDCPPKTVIQMYRIIRN